MSDTIQDVLTDRFQAVGTGLATGIYVFLLIPILVTIPMAFGPTNAFAFPPAHYSLALFRIFFNSPDWLGPLFESLKVAAASTVLALIAGLPAGYWLSRHEFVGKSLFTGVIMSPLIIPPIVTGLGLFLYLSLLKVSGTTISIVLGHLMVTLPYVILMVVAGVSKLDRNLEFGAELMGAGSLRMFTTVVIPQLVPSLVSAMLFAFLLSFDEVIISWFLAGSGTVTLPVKMYSALQWEVSPVIAAVSTFLTAVSLVISVIAIMTKRGEPVDV